MTAAAQPRLLVVMTKHPPKRKFLGTRDGITRQFATKRAALEYAFNAGEKPMRKVAR